MLIIEIQTPDGLADVDRAGKPLAAVLRSLADRIEQDIVITPTSRSGHEWKTETYRHTHRADGVLIGAVATIRADAR